MACAKKTGGHGALAGGGSARRKWRAAIEKESEKTAGSILEKREKRGNGLTGDQLPADRGS
jgi:hypothetical protein